MRASDRHGVVERDVPEWRMRNGGVRKLEDARKPRSPSVNERTTVPDTGREQTARTHKRTQARCDWVLHCRDPTEAPKLRKARGGRKASGRSRRFPEDGVVVCPKENPVPSF